MASRVALRGVVVGALALALGACGSGTGGGSDASAPSDGGSPSAAAPTSPSVAPATGRKIETTLFSYRLPAGLKWDMPDKDGSLASYFGHDGFWDFSNGEYPARTGGLDELARISIGDHQGDYPKGGLKRLADRTIAGHTGYVLEGHGPGPEAYLWEWGTWADGTAASLSFTAPADNAKAHKMLDSVIASIQWK